jgi:hypothetical protein
MSDVRDPQITQITQKDKAERVEAGEDGSRKGAKIRRERIGVTS